MTTPKIQETKKVHHIIDASGLLCPFPLLQLQKKLKIINNQEIIKLISTDKGSVHDVRSFCMQTNHFLIHEMYDEIQSHFIFTIQKNDSK